MDRILLKDIISVQRFAIQEDHWEREPYSGTHFLAYKLHGYTLHECDGALLPFGRDMLMIANNADHYRVLQHERAAEGPKGSCISVHFTTMQPFDMHLAVYNCSGQPRIRSSFFKMLDAWNQYRTYGNMSAEYACISCFYTLMAHVSLLAGQNAAPNGDRLTLAKAYMERHYADSTLSMADVAASASLGQRRFGALFQARYHKTPGKYLTDCRIAAAMQLLKQPEMSISQIAALCGYASASYFIRVFRQETGASPAAYRKMQR